MYKSILRDQVRIGMFIHRFEGSWFKHPFWRGRFLLVDADDMTAIAQSGIERLIIDTSKGLDVDEPASLKPSGIIAPVTTTPSRSTNSATVKPARAIRQDDGRERARIEASRVADRSKKVMREIFDAARLGKAGQCAAVTAVVADLTTMIEKNRQAFLKVLRLKSKDEYTYLHSVAVCALMINLGRQIKLDEATIADLSTAGLLHDIGKMLVPDALLNKAGRLTDAEFSLMRTHAERGFELLKDIDAVPELALDVCRHHHEKIDGSGYPENLSGSEISLAARMGAICDVYDALTSNRAYKEAWTPVEAITRMQSWDGHFDPALLFSFMQSIDTYPVGLIVQLRSNRIGVVLDNGRRASRPKVLAFYSTREEAWIDNEIVMIGETLSRDAILANVDPADWGISQSDIDAILNGRAPNRQLAG
ncbi:HD-GYP domain-containing protein [Sphingobium soli]|uniref:HD-GYP domain-containing protein n=1 Tax=Sphingobium soli TaxID=1591116 RepID=A0ABS8GY06_9SPHN|nr:HD-GYP domain-containing protein [Sphingobium soli]MCC4231166.1 HD-GYP domain-containing protein [Sphingobium soli]